MTEDNFDKIGDKIYDLRKKLNISQDYLAEKVGVTRQTISKWEANIVIPQLEKLKIICKVLNVGIECFVPREEVAIEMNGAENLVACEEVGQNVEVDKNIVNQNQQTSKRKLSQKTKIKIVAIVLAVLMLFSIAMIIFDNATMSSKREGAFSGAEVRLIWNFSIENIGWIIFSISLAIAIVLGITLIIKKIKYNTNSHICEQKVVEKLSD